MIYDKSGKLTRVGMEATIAAGGTVLHKGKIHATLEKLPSEAELAGDDEESQKTAQDNLDKRQAELDAERAKLTPTRKK